MALSAQITNFTSDTVTVKITGMNTSYRVKSAACSIYELDDAFCTEYSQDLSNFESEVEFSVATSDCNFETSQHQMVISVIYNNSVDDYEELDPIPFGGYSISVSTTSITFTFNTARAYYFWCFVRTPDNVTVIDEWVDYHNPGYSITFTGLDPRTEYVCNAQYSLTDGYGGKWMGAKTFTTLPIWTVEEIVVDPNNDDDDLGSLYYTKYPLVIEPYTIYRFKFQSPYTGVAKFTIIQGSCITYITLSDEFYIESGEPVDILYSSTGGFDYSVTKGVTYYCWVRLQNGATTNKNVYFGINFPTQDEGSSIDQWSWTASNGLATASQTSAAKNAITNKTAISNFSYLVWNDMVDKVLEILDATGGSWNTTYASDSSTKMSSSDKILTATRFNSLRINIDVGSSTGVSEVSKGDPVYGSYFTTLATHINNWINSI